MSGTTSHGILWRCLTYPRRRWRTRGYGIHSPFAYSMLRNVVHATYQYYGTAQLMRYPRRIARRARLLLRLGSFMDVHSAWLSGVIHEGLIKAFHHMRSDIVITRAPFNGTTNMIVVGEDAPASLISNMKALITNYADRDMTLLFTNIGPRNPAATQSAELIVATGQFVTFTDGAILVAVRRGGMSEGALYNIVFS